MELSDRVVAGDARAVARAISVVERETADASVLVGRLHGHTGHARVVGFTGAPGVGKSTLVDRLTAHWREAGTRVAVLAVDPTSPFTGGALLGDRIRMQSHSGDDGVFVRSMATRGHLGGLAPATHDAVIVLDAAGFDVVAIETVGVGQGEVDIVSTADISIVITVPGTGDDVQAIKAGVMEIADVFVVNKADRDGADRAVAEIEAMLSLRAADPGTVIPPVIQTSAATGDGVSDLAACIETAASRPDDRARRRRDRTRARIEAIVRRRVARLVETLPALEEEVERVVVRDADPYQAAERIARQVMKEPSS